jgi:two-component system cell cycle sensor histidine kinase/response regulator CckA
MIWSSHLSNKILLVEDDADLAELFSQALTSEGYTVDKFTDPVKACSSFEANPSKYQLVISDVRMPGMTGLQLVKRINKINRNVKVLMTSAFELNSLGSDLKEVSIEAFLEKPMHMNQLLSVVEKTMKIRN